MTLNVWFGHMGAATLWVVAARFGGAGVALLVVQDEAISSN